MARRTFACLLFLLASSPARSALAQGFTARDLFAPAQVEESAPGIVIEGDDERLRLREYVGIRSVGEVWVTSVLPSGRHSTHAQSVLRRQYVELGSVGARVSIAPGVYALTVAGTTIPRHFHEARAYEVSIVPDVVALRLGYVDRSVQRRRMWLTTSLVSVVGGVLCLASTADVIQSPDSIVNRPMMFTGAALLGSFQFTFMIPLFRRDDAVIDVVHADGTVVRARRRVRN